VVAKLAVVTVLGLALCLLSVAAGGAAAINCSDKPLCSIPGGTTLNAGQSLRAGRTTLAMQTDGNLVLYRIGGSALWASSLMPAQDAPEFAGPTQALDCAHCYAVFQTDGNLVLYNPNFRGNTDHSYWASNTPGNRGATLTLSASFPLAIVSSSGSILWRVDLDPGKAGSNDATSWARRYEKLMGQLWSGGASFQPIVNMQIETEPDSGAPFVDGMNEGTQIVPLNGVWYLFNREYDYAPHPIDCKADFSRIVARKSADRGRTWSDEAVLAEPDPAHGECALGDGFAYWDADHRTWHYLAQLLRGNEWNITHFTREAPDPLGRFEPDSANPVITSGQLWRAICGQGKSCPSGTEEEGTPEISFTSKGSYYMTFHGARIDGATVFGYRGIAKTRDFRTWITFDEDLPNDAIWSPKDCQRWNVAWNTATGCIGGGHASSLITPHYTYMLIESADVSLSCTAGQHWVVGLVRARGFVGSGHWSQFSGNPIMSSSRSDTACSIQYPRMFEDEGSIYLSYWTLGRPGPHDANIFFHIAKLQSNP
jgi:hypothetical protein